MNSEPPSIWMALIAFFILLLAGINFVTLSTARAGRRAKEVGIRKVLGAERRRLIVQNLSFQLFQSGAILLGLLGLALVVGLLAGLYPALVLAGFSPQKKLKSQTGTGRERRFFRYALVTFQYVVSIALICCTLIVQDQLRYLKNYNLGYNKDQLVEFELSGQLRLKRDVFKAEVLLIPGVEKASLNDTALMQDRNEMLFVFEGAAAGDRQVLPRVFADADYLPTLGASLAAGRNFDRDMPTDRDTVILNDTLIRRLGWTEPLVKTVKMLDTNEGEKFVELPYTVVGVVKDFFFESLHAPLRGQVIVNRDQDFTVLFFKLRAEAIPAALGAIQQVWKKFEPEHPFEYAFVSETFDRLYRADQRLGKVFLAFTLLALFVAGPEERQRTSCRRATTYTAHTGRPSM